MRKRERRERFGSAAAGWLLLVTWAWAAAASAQVAAPAAVPAPSSAPTPVIELDPVMDGAILGTGLVVGPTLELMLGSTELRPQPPGDPAALPGIDRWRAESDDVMGGGLSDIGRGVLFGYAALDIGLVELLDRGDPWYHYAVVYAESVALTLVITDIVKLAVRRPRPSAYRAVRDGDMPSERTNTALSFFSGHASLSAAVSATAIYLAFARRASALERWLVFAGGLVITAAVSAARVLEGVHFPTDVMAGASVGAAVGLIVPHLHRRDDASDGGIAVRAWSGPEGAAGLSVGGAI